VLTPFSPRVVTIRPALESFESDFLTNVGSAFTRSARVAEKDFLPVKKAKRRHNVRCNRELNARRGHGIP
jgi:hypothetical protein